MKNHSAKNKNQVVLAVASKGGHWEQLMILRPALESFQTVYANTMPGLAEKNGLFAHSLPDANRNSLFGIANCVWESMVMVRNVRPSLVISTGALPGLLTLAFGKIFGAKTVWIDSVANSEKLSLSGKVAGTFVDLQLTQWEHLAKGQTKYLGNVL